MAREAGPIAIAVQRRTWNPAKRPGEIRKHEVRVVVLSQGNGLVFGRRKRAPRHIATVGLVPQGIPVFVVQEARIENAAAAQSNLRSLHPLPNAANLLLSHAVDALDIGVERENVHRVGYKLIVEALESSGGVRVVLIREQHVVALRAQNT